MVGGVAEGSNTAGPCSLWLTPGPCPRASLPASLSSQVQKLAQMAEAQEHLQWIHPRLGWCMLTLLL